MSSDVINQFYFPEWLTVEFVAHNFISFTPLFSYGSTVVGIYKKKTSLGFSLDICLTMILSASLRIAYYFITPYEIALFRQSVIMILIQIVLLKVSLKFKRDLENQYYSTDNFIYLKELREILKELLNQDLNFDSIVGFVEQIMTLHFIKFLRFFDPNFKRFKSFWQWNNEINYWIFIGYFESILLVLTILFKNYEKFGEVLGVLGLFVESLLPLPQILLLNKLKSVDGFKIILLVSWYCGDFTKISYLIFGAKEISKTFLFFAVFQMLLDVYFGYRYIYFKYFYIKDDSHELKEIKV
ncbi:hypothetical protein WICMUC_002537 [Wickerhamomyces mucosus]|uniref:PQ-loop repeat-containing protein 1 n=1 Tax=Wickerhamomyces mucosus TaxID=1378264 RepID=A0A9P8PQB9_9ASCO|nr:hypothetical protein WICMUC_002537 [Wickerhamomyces mucosus]